MEALLCIAIAMGIGLLFNRLANKLGLPNVTGYLVGGLIAGPYMFGFIGEEVFDAAKVITSVALGFIAFSIGGEFRLKHIKQIGKSVIIITIIQAFGAVIAVLALLLLMGFDPPIAIALSAIATATAPAATLMVVRQYHAKGPVTNILLPVVAMDDAVGLMTFSVAIAIAQGITNGGGMSLGVMLIEPLIEIVASMGVGAIIGLFVSLILRFFHSNANKLIIVVFVVFLGTALAENYGFSSLLLSMTSGAVIANLRDDSEKLLELNDQWTQPLFLLFFVLSGAELDPRVIPTVGVLGIAYLVARSLGKYFGAGLGAKLVHADENIVKYLGLTLLPQAGVAIGMCRIAANGLPKYGEQITAVVLCATLVYELVGPLITKVALTKAGEIEGKA